MSPGRREPLHERGPRHRLHVLAIDRQQLGARDDPGRGRELWGSASEAEELVAAHEAVGAPVVLRAFDGGHAAWGTLIDDQPVVEVCFEYLVETMGLELAAD